VNFIVLEGTPEFIILKEFGSDFVAAQFDRERREIRNTFAIVSLEHYPSKFEFEKIGGISVWEGNEDEPDVRSPSPNPK
jgi:hypothetical protein